MRAATDRDRAAYWLAVNWLVGSTNELPAGVLDGAKGATVKECAEMLEALDAFAALCARLGLTDHEAFIEACRWHFEHYAHYLGRRTHFANYEQYILDRKGPVRVPDPPAVPRWLQQF